MSQFHSTKRAHRFFALAACTMLAACGPSAAAKKATADSLAAAAAAAATPAPPMLSDANIVAVLDEANMADSSGGAMMRPMAMSNDVKGYAKMMMDDHHDLRAKGEKLAKDLSIAPQMPTTDPFADGIAKMKNAMTGAAKSRATDSTYIAMEIDMHNAVISWANNAANQTQTQALKDLITGAGPTLQKHLDRAKEIQANLNKAKM